MCVAMSSQARVVALTRQRLVVALGPSATLEDVFAALARTTEAKEAASYRHVRRARPLVRAND